MELTTQRDKYYFAKRHFTNRKPDTVPGNFARFTDGLGIHFYHLPIKSEDSWYVQEKTKSLLTPGRIVYTSGIPVSELIV